MSGSVRNSRKAMKSKSPSARAASPSFRNGMPATKLERRSKPVPLEGLARLSTDVFSENPIAHLSLSDSKPFLGVVICVTGYSREARREVQITAERMGGQYSRDLHVNCTHLVVQIGRKYEHAVKHGVHRGLHVVIMSWFEDCVKQNARLDESIYVVPRNLALSHDHHDPVPAVVLSSNRRKFPSADNQDMEAMVRLQPISLANSSGGSLRNSTSMPRTPHSSLATDKSCHALAGARFFIDPALPRDLQLKAQEAAESWGATCVENWSKATHVVCESETISKYIGLNLHLVSPMWIMSARDGFPLRCVQYSADLARDVADLLLDWKKKGKHNNKSLLGNFTVHSDGNRAAAVTVEEREKKAIAAKEGVRRRRGPRMQPCRTLTRLNTPTSLLDSIFWIVSDTPATAQLYTNSTGKVLVGNGNASEAGHGFHHNDPLDEALGTEIYTKPLSRSDKREIVFRGAFLTIVFPIDRFSELGPSSQTFFSENGFTREQIINLVYAFYQEPLSPAEVEAALHTDSKHADRLRALYSSPDLDELGHVAMLRHQFLGSRLQFEGLKRANQDPTSHIYDLWLGS